MTRRTGAELILVAAVVGAVYTFSLGNPFHFDDDQYILRNPAVMAFDAWREQWSWQTAYSRRFLYHLSLALNHRLGGLSPWGYHLFNVVGHLLAVTAVWLLTRALTKDKDDSDWMPTAAALLFGLHPLAATPPLYVMARNSGWSSLLLLWSLLLAVWALGKHRRRLLLGAAAVGCWLAAVSFKETALIAPLLLGLLLVHRHGLPSGRTNRLVLSGLPLLFVVAVVLLPRLVPRNPLNLDFLSSQLVILMQAWVHVVLPGGVAIEHDPVFYTSAFAWPVLVALAFHLCLAGCGVLGLWRRQLDGFGICWAYFCVAPTNSVLFRSDLLSDRNLYLFVLGGIWWLLGLCQRATSRKPDNRRIVIGAIAVLAIVCVVQTARQVYRFGDRVRLLEAARESAPRHLRLLLNLGQEYEHGGQLLQAERMYAGCIANWETGHNAHYPQRDQWASMALNNLGALVADRDAEAAEAYFTRSLVVEATNPLALDNLATIWLARGEYTRLAAAAEVQLAVNPSARAHRGCARVGLGRREGAIADLAPFIAEAGQIPARLRARALAALLSLPALDEKLAASAAAALREVIRRQQLPPGTYWQPKPPR